MDIIFLTVNRSAVAVDSHNWSNWTQMQGCIDWCCSINSKVHSIALKFVLGTKKQGVAHLVPPLAASGTPFQRRTVARSASSPRRCPRARDRRSRSSCFLSFGEVPSTLHQSTVHAPHLFWQKNDKEIEVQGELFPNSTGGDVLEEEMQVPTEEKLYSQIRE